MRGRGVIWVQKLASQTPSNNWLPSICMAMTGLMHASRRNSKRSWGSVCLYTCLWDFRKQRAQLKLGSTGQRQPCNLKTQHRGHAEISLWSLPLWRLSGGYSKVGPNGLRMPAVALANRGTSTSREKTHTHIPARAHTHAPVLSKAHLLSATMSPQHEASLSPAAQIPVVAVRVDYAVGLKTACIYIYVCI